MPHINRIRINNVKYNFGTQFYDDFIMRPSCKNMIYDLANGGGKSVLMLLLLQNLIPNCTLDEKQPIEKLFRSQNGSTTIHSLVEWKLDEGDVEHNYKFMTTGFCARKARKDEEDPDSTENAAVEYFNYCIFYREFNDNDIKNLPLTNGKERITYTGLKAYLRELEKKDYGLKVRVFERKGDYQHFISGYGLYESQWEIIRGINKTEGHVRTYFETNYKTTRKVVEELFIEEIIRKSFLNKIEKSQEQDTMAQTLMDIKDKLLELAKRKSEISDYDLQTEVLEGFIQRLQTFKGACLKKERTEQQLIQIYNTQAEAEKEFAKERLKAAQQKLAVEKELWETSRQIETAKIQQESGRMKELESQIGRLLEEAGHLQEKLNFLEESRKEKEAGNLYLDYRQYREESQVIKETLSQMQKGRGSLIKELSGLAASIGLGFQEELEELIKELSAQEDLEAREAKDYRRLEDEERSIDKELAVMEHELCRLESSEKENAKRFEALRGECNILFGADLESLYREKQTRTEDICRMEEKLLKSRNSEAGRIEKLHLKIRELSLELMDAKKKLSEAGDFITEKKEHARRVEALSEAYGVSGCERLKERILQEFAGIEVKKSELSALIKETEDYSGLSEKGIYPGGNRNIRESLIKTKEYIERCHDIPVRLGTDYLNTLDEYEKGEALSRMPALPFALVAERGLPSLLSDTHMGEMGYGEYPVMVVEQKWLEKPQGQREEKNICFFTRLGELYVSPKLWEQEVRRMKRLLEEKQEERKQLAIRQAAVCDDLGFIQEFSAVYGEREQRMWDSYQEAKAQAAALEEAKTAAFASLKELEISMVHIEREQEALQEEKQRSRKEEEALGELMLLSAQESSFFTERSELLEKKHAMEKRHRDVKAHLEAFAARNQARKEKTNNLKNEIKSKEKEWQEVYAPYLAEQSKPVPPVEPPESLESLKLKFKGRKEAYEKEFANGEDKQKLLQNYEKAMEKALQSIAYNGNTLVNLEKAFLEHRIIKTDHEELIRMKQEFHSLEKETKELNRTIHEKQEGKSRLEGSVSRGIKTIVEKYGFYEEIRTDEKNLSRFIDDKTQMLSVLNQDLTRMEAHINKMDENSTEFVAMKKELERMIQEGELDPRHSGELLPEGTDALEAYRKAAPSYRRLLKDIYGRREEFEKDKIRLSDTLSKLNAHDLARELKRNVAAPATARDTEALQDGIRDTINCIALEKDRVEKSIQDMEAMKSHFVDQCLQTCENIKIELERLSKLSTIEMDGENISVISLQIPYKKPEFYHAKMGQYIEALAEKADEYKIPGERLKCIRSGLAWKRLFSVIVTDMNAIRLNLYKRERIKEQSRSLKYEEAVGSTGQSQGIYIQFLIGVINYIASISSAKAEGKGLKKVIFIDNPFGAAKDIYIWEPIFKLLKVNNVQLIVPCRGATPAITARFDVNYILGQKMSEGKQQTVVVDYFSSVKQDEIEYTAMEYEQQVLFE